jgi:hypothetical protein
MMYVRARVYTALQSASFDSALDIVDEGLATIHELTSAGGDERDADPPEISVLQRLREEVLEKMPADAPPRLESALRSALAREDYEEAARLRDRLTRAGRVRVRR